MSKLLFQIALASIVACQKDDVAQIESATSNVKESAELALSGPLDLDSPSLFITYLGEGEFIAEMDPDFSEAAGLDDAESQRNFYLNVLAIVAAEDPEGMLEADTISDQSSSAELLQGKPKKASQTTNEHQVVVYQKPQAADNPRSTIPEWQTQSYRSSTETLSRRDSSRSSKDSAVDPVLQRQMANEVRARDAKYVLVNLYQTLVPKERPRTYFRKKLPKKYEEAIKTRLLTDRTFGYDRLESITYERGMVDADHASFEIKIPPIFLGMLPTEKMVRSITNTIRKEGFTDLEIFGIIKTFEFAVASGIKDTLQNIRGKILAKRGFDIGGPVTQQVLDNMATKGVKVKWSITDVWDRNIVPKNKLLGTINKVIATLDNGKPVYIHCKSGKGRSAMVAVGAHAFLVIDQMKSMGDRQLSKADVDRIILLEIDRVKRARTEVELIPEKLIELRQVAYERAGLLPSGKSKQVEPKLERSSNNQPQQNP